MLGLSTYSNDCGGALCRRGPSTGGCRGCHPFVAQLTPDGPAAKAGILLGDHLLSVNERPTPSQKEFAKAVQAAGDEMPSSCLFIEVRRSEHEPNIERFGEYCEAHPLSRADIVFQSKHSDIGGWCTAGDAAMDADVMQCDGCPECLFGKPMAGLTEEESSDPKVLRWAARPGWLRHHPYKPSDRPPRFAVGERVLYRDGKMSPWTEATVLTRKHSEPCWPAGFWVPYTLRCKEDRKIIYTPLDTDDLVKRVHGPPKPGAAGGPMPSPTASPARLSVMSKGITKGKGRAQSDLSLYR